MLTFQDLAIQRGPTVLFEKANAQIHPGQKVGLTGRNGTGKSSLFACIRHEIPIDQGSLDYPTGWRISSVAQETPGLEKPAIDYVTEGDHHYTEIQKQISECPESDGTQLAQLHAQLDAIDGYQIHTRAAQLLAGLGFTEQEQKQSVKSFSGGWRMRLNLAQALIQPSDLLLLDEPTNHLDLDTVIWLERWLTRYPGTLLLISHDRTFLDNIITHTLQLENQQLTLYPGNYTAFEKKRAALLANQQAMLEKQQRERAHLQSFVDRFKAKASKAKQAQSRVKALAKMETIALAHVDSAMHFSFATLDRMPSPLVSLDNTTAGYGDISILNPLQLSINPGDRIGLLGPNGAGKSTLIKLIAQELTPQSGDIIYAKDMTIGYFAQHQLEQLEEHHNAFSALQKQNPTHTEQQIRNFLGQYGFNADKAFTEIDHLSGGEKARLVFSMLIAQKPHLLLLDEPTNHLDIDMRHAINVALQSYEGGMIIVSHDRFLLESVTDQFYLVSDGKLTPYDGDLSDYQSWLQKQSDAAEPSEESISVNSKKLQRQEKAQLRKQLQPIQNKVKKLDKKLHELQQKQATLEEKLADAEIYNDDNKETLKKLLAEQATLNQDLEQTEMDWLDFSEQLEELENSL
ncbi:MAG: ATP-binding cassette domain-containing protein [Methylococcales bacterium]|jgi:ATP-binding cassette, subfamily F, member 3|nr:ATP-binding cassette domain-containing protein [Methylococcales bacterium]